MGLGVVLLPVQAQAALVNVAQSSEGGVASQSSTGFGGVASRGNDGNTNGVYGGGSVTHTQSEAGAWWQVDLGELRVLESIMLFNRIDCCGDRLDNFRVSVWVGNPNAAGIEAFGQDYSIAGGVPGSLDVDLVALTGDAVIGDFVRVELNDTNFLALAEVQAFTEIPEPASVATLALALAGFGFRRSRRPR